MNLQELKNRPEMKRMDKIDKELRHEPIELYCLGCGKMISDHFTGGIWSYTHPCNFEEQRKNLDNEDFKSISCVVFGSKKFGVMIPSSILCGYKSHARCRECKSEEEHIKKVLEGCGLSQEFKSDNENVKKLRAEAILKITACCTSEYGNKCVIQDKAK